MEVGIWLVLGLAALPALGNFAGGLLADWLRPSKHTLNLALHASAGIILAVIAVEVMPQALPVAPAWLLALAFIGGGAAYLAMEAGVDRWQRSKPGGAGTGAWMVYVAVATDLIGDGLLIGAGSAVSGELALVLALGQLLADGPEGFAVVANFRDKGFGRVKRMLISASFALPVIGAALLAYFVLRGQGEVVKMAALVFVGGVFMERLGRRSDILAAARVDCRARPGRAAGAGAGVGGYSG